jgi:D-alanyl-D-alanine carboxypeptidase
MHRSHAETASPSRRGRLSFARTLAAVVAAGTVPVALPEVAGSEPFRVAAGAPGHLARPAVADRAQPIQRLARDLVREGAPGALVVLRTPTVVQRGASGFGRLKPRTRLRATDRFRIASVTKTFVATVVLQLIGERRLSLDDRVERWLPGMIPNGGAITVRQLLSHTSGLFDYDDDKGWIQARIVDPGREWSPQELVAIATAHPPLFAPGSSWSYSNTNYILLGLVIEKVSSRSLGDELRSRVFKPLALKSTSFPTGTSIAGRYAHGYFVSRPPLPLPPGTLIDVSTILSPSAWGAGQIISNGDDLTTFLAALLRGRLLPAPQLAAMRTLVADSGYGLGLRRYRTRCGNAYGHDGDVPGYRNIAIATLNGRRATSIMVNIDTRVSWNALREAATAALCSR